MDENLVILVVLGLTVLALPFIFYFVNESAKRDFAKNKASLEENGYVIGHWYQKDYGNITVCWGQFTKPLPLYLRVSNRSPMEQLFANMGVKDIKTGDAIFDQSFVLRSNLADIAVNILHSFRTELLSFKDVEFQTGSMDSLLSADHWPDIEDERRKARKFWKVTTRGKLTDEQMQSYLELAQRLAIAIEKACVMLPSNNQDCETTMFEGR